MATFHQPPPFPPSHPQKAFVIIVGHDIATNASIPPGLQPLSPYKQPPKETDRKEENNIVGVVVVECNWTFIFRHFERYFEQCCGATSLDALKKKL